MTFTHVGPNGTQEGNSLVANVFQDLGHPNVEIAALISSNEFFRQSFSFCTFANPKGVKLIVGMFFAEINKIINPEILKCPVKKGVYRACDFSKFGNVKFENIPVLPFMKLGQTVDITITIRSFINRRKEFLLSVLLRHYISN